MFELDVKYEYVDVKGKMFGEGIFRRDCDDGVIFVDAWDVNQEPIGKFGVDNHHFVADNINDLIKLLAEDGIILIPFMDEVFGVKY